jgi:hypothetical protein
MVTLTQQELQRMRVRACAASCAKPTAAQSVSDFGPLPLTFDLARCLSFRYQRVVAKDHTVAWAGEVFQLPPLPARRSLAGKVVELSYQNIADALVVARHTP